MDRFRNAYADLERWEESSYVLVNEGFSGMGAAK